MINFALFAIIGVKINAPIGYWIIYAIGILLYVIALVLREGE